MIQENNNNNASNIRFAWLSDEGLRLQNLPSTTNDVELKGHGILGRSN